MRRADVSSSLHRYLVKCAAYPHCHALVAPATPRRLPDDPAVAQSVMDAMQALERLKVATDLLPNSDMVTRTLARREAVQSSQIEGTRTQLHELLEYEATQSRDGLPPDATVTQRYVQALDLGRCRGPVATGKGMNRATADRGCGCTSVSTKTARSLRTQTATSIAQQPGGPVRVVEAVRMPLFAIAWRMALTHTSPTPQPASRASAGVAPAGR